MPSKCWKFSAGSRPNTVTVFERESGGMIYARAWIPNAKRFRRVSLGHHDKARAKRYATDEAAKLQKGEATIADVKLTLSALFALYEQHRTPKKSAKHQEEDRRRIELFTRFLGNIDPHSLTLRQWEAFIDARSSGAIDPRGNAVAEKERRPRRARAVEIDLRWLKAVLNWANKWKLDSGRYLMRENPARGYEIEKEKNVRRPIATQDRFEALRAKSDQHMAFFGKSGTLEKRRSYLSELLDIVNGTGRRIAAVCSLNLGDLRLERTKNAPHGAIVWPYDVDKMKRERGAPITPAVRAAIDGMLTGRKAIGRVPLFPAPEDASKPLSRHTANKWLIEGEKLAGLEKQKGGLWHAYRRKWATERKHLPRADVAASGGWASTKTLDIYTQADEATMLSVVLGGGELREAK